MPCSAKPWPSTVIGWPCPSASGSSPPNKGTNIVVFARAVRAAGVWSLEVIVETPDPQVVDGPGDSVALAGSVLLGGDSPVLDPWGSLEAGSQFGVRNYDLFHSVNAWFVLGLKRIDLPFKGGLLAPSP
mgnify:CR=1 FL=1